jgi:hypothetical protein
MAFFFAMAVGGPDERDLFAYYRLVCACMHANPYSHYAQDSSPIFFLHGPMDSRSILDA